MIATSFAFVMFIGLIGAGSWLRKNRRAVFITIGALSGTGGIVAVAVMGGDTLYKSEIPPPPKSQTYIDLVAARDISALPLRSSWCTGSNHCWTFQQLSGDAIDYGDTGGWDLTPNGSPRAGVSVMLPTVDSTGWVEFDEKAVFIDGVSAQGYKEDGVDSVPGDATNLVSVTAIFATYPNGNQRIVNHRSAYGYEVYINSSTGVVSAIGDGPDAAKTIAGSTDASTGWHCTTIVLDGRTVDAGKIYLDGADDTSATKDLSATGSWLQNITFWAGRYKSAGSELIGGIARLRIDYGEALSLAEHQTLCSAWQPPAGGTANNKPSASDDTWAQTGGTKCYPTGAASAVCMPGGLIPYTLDATGWGWPTEPTAVNRVTYSTAIDCTNWTCDGTTVASAAVAPDGSLSAVALTLGAWSTNDIYQGATGYTVSTTLYPRAWVNCSTGSLRFGATSGTGQWTVDCSCVAGAWTLINSASHSCVNQVAAWQSSAGGASGIGFSAASGNVQASVWAPTLTETQGTATMVIPTAASAVGTGTPVWIIDNSGGGYYHTGDTITQSLTQHSGSCWYIDGTDLRLNGASGSPCTGVWYGLEVAK